MPDAAIQYNLLSLEDKDEEYLLAIVDGEPFATTSANPNFESILAQCRDGETDDAEAFIALFDLSAAVAKKLEKLSERVSVAHGRVYFDGDEVSSPLAKQIARFIEEGVEDYKPLVAFFEKVQANPNAHSRDQLYNWLDKHEFTLTQEGDIVGYKGVTSADDEGVRWSINSGTAIVDGEEVSGRIPNKIGSVIEMPRESVQHDPSVGCHRGLHVGTFNYARSFGTDLLEVHVNPRDVVSVPTDCSWQKVRCCRYKVVNTIEAQYGSAVLPLDVDGSDEDDYMFIIDIDLS